VLTGAFLIIYRYAPALRRNWKNILPGAGTAAVLFIIVSVGFSIYVANFGKYDKQYGALGAVVVTMLWLYFGAFIFLLGAEITAQQHQNRETRDTRRHAT
jgi:membrane protein